MVTVEERLGLSVWQRRLTAALERIRDRMQPQFQAPLEVQSTFDYSGLCILEKRTRYWLWFFREFTYCQYLIVDYNGSERHGSGEIVCRIFHPPILGIVREEMTKYAERFYPEHKLSLVKEFEE